MSTLSRFLKQNKVVRQNEKHVATATLTDEKGNPLEWEFKHISSKENEKLRDDCTADVPVTGKPGMYRQKFKTREYLAKMVAASVAVPDLYNAELQDSYGVKTPTDLLYALVDSPGEYQELCAWVQKFQGFTETLEDKAEEAKNS